MSDKPQQQQPQHNKPPQQVQSVSQPATAKQTAPAAVQPTPPQTSTRTPAEVPAYRHCPLCHGVHRGVGIAYCTQGRTRYYKCNECAHTWKVTVTTEVESVSHRPVDTQER